MFSIYSLYMEKWGYPEMSDILINEYFINISLFNGTMCNATELFCNYFYCDT